MSVAPWVLTLAAQILVGIVLVGGHIFTIVTQVLFRKKVMPGLCAVAGITYVLLVGAVTNKTSMPNMLALGVLGLVLPIAALIFNRATRSALTGAMVACGALTSVLPIAVYRSWELPIWQYTHLATVAIITIVLFCIFMRKQWQQRHPQYRWAS